MARATRLRTIENAGETPESSSVHFDSKIPRRVINIPPDENEMSCRETICPHNCAPPTNWRNFIHTSEGSSEKELLTKQCSRHPSLRNPARGLCNTLVAR